MQKKKKKKRGEREKDREEISGYLSKVYVINIFDSRCERPF